MKKTTRLKRKKNTQGKTLRLPVDLHQDINDIARIEGRTVGRQAEVFLRQAVTLWYGIIVEGAELMPGHSHILTPAETASRVVAALARRLDLSHDQQAAALIIVSQAVEADRNAIYNHYADTAAAIIAETNREENDHDDTAPGC